MGNESQLLLERSDSLTAQAPTLTSSTGRLQVTVSRSGITVMLPSSVHRAVCCAHCIIPGPLPTTRQCNATASKFSQERHCSCSSREISLFPRSVSTKTKDGSFQEQSRKLPKLCPHRSSWRHELRWIYRFKALPRGCHPCHPNDQPSEFISTQ